MTSTPLLPVPSHAGDPGALEPRPRQPPEPRPALRPVPDAAAATPAPAPVRVRVLVAHEHRIVREGLAALLAADADLAVVATAGDGGSALHEVARHRPDVAVLGLDLPGLDGLELARRVAERHPCTRVLLTSSGDGDAVRALRAGATGFVPAGCGAVEARDAVRLVAAGGLALGPGCDVDLAALLAPAAAPAAPAEPFPQLTPRERETLHGLAAGRSNDQIARACFVSGKTVRNAVSSIYAKLQVATRAEAVVVAREAGYGLGGHDGRGVPA